MKLTSNYELKKPEGTDTVNIEDFNYNADIIDTELKKKADLVDGKVSSNQLPEMNYLSPNGEGKDITVTFTEAGARENISTTEKLSVIFGKIKKFFTDLKTVAFTGSYADLTNKPTSLPANGGTSSACSGNAATATKLQTARAINGVNFDGTQNITVADSTKAPSNHASTGNAYGLGTPTNYGHVKTINNLAQASHLDGTALSAYQGKVLNDKINNVSKISIIKGAVTKPNDNIASFDVNIPITSANTIELDLSTNMTVQNATGHTNGILKLKIHIPTGKIKGVYGYNSVHAYGIFADIGSNLYYDIASAYTTLSIHLRLRQISVIGSILKISFELSTVVNWNCVFDYIVEEIA